MGAASPRAGSAGLAGFAGLRLFGGLGLGVGRGFLGRLPFQVRSPRRGALPRSRDHHVPVLGLFAGRFRFGGDRRFNRLRIGNVEIHLLDVETLFVVKRKGRHENEREKEGRRADHAVTHALVAKDFFGRRRLRRFLFGLRFALAIAHAPHRFARHGRRHHGLGPVRFERSFARGFFLGFGRRRPHGDHGVGRSARLHVPWRHGFGDRRRHLFKGRNVLGRNLGRVLFFRHPVAQHGFGAHLLPRILRIGIRGPLAAGLEEIEHVSLLGTPPHKGTGE